MARSTAPQRPNTQVLFWFTRWSERVNLCRFPFTSAFLRPRAANDNEAAVFPTLSVFLLAAGGVSRDAALDNRVPNLEIVRVINPLFHPLTSASNRASGSWRDSRSVGQ